MNSCKEGTARLLRFSGIPWLIRELLCRKKLSIIVYHDPSPEALACHLEYLTSHYNLISLSAMMAAIHAQDRNALPAKSLVVTVDDGHVRNFRLREIFLRHNLVPTVYLCSHIIGTHRLFWPSLVGKGEGALRKRKHQEFLGHLKNEYDYAPEREYAARQALSLAEIVAMRPGVDFQCHGKNHFSLPRCDADMARDEILNSKKKLEELFESKCEHFAFPFGDYTDREVNLVKECGFQSARTTDPGWNDLQTDPFRLKIVAMIPDNASENMLCAQLSGLPSLFGKGLNRVKSLFD